MVSEIIKIKFDENYYPSNKILNKHFGYKDHGIWELYGKNKNKKFYPLAYHGVWGGSGFSGTQCENLDEFFNIINDVSENGLAKGYLGTSVREDYLQKYNWGHTDNESVFNIIVVKGLEEKLLHSIRNLQHIDRGTPINMQNISEPTVYDEKAMRNIQFEDSEEAGLTMKTIPPENITIYYCIVPPEKLGLNKFQNIFVTEKIYSKQELKSKDKRMMIAAKTFKGGPFSISSLIRILTMDKMWDEIKLIEGVEINYKWLSKDRLKELEQGSQFTIDEIKKLFKEVNGLEEYYNELTQVYEGELKQIIKAEYEELREDYFNNIKRVSDQVLERVAKDFLKNGETKTIIKPILMDHKSKELIAPDSL